MAPPTDAFGACRTQPDNETPQMRQRNFERRTKNKTELRSEPLASSTSGFYPKALSGPERPGQDPPHSPPWWPPRRCLQDLDLQGQVSGMCRQVRRAGVWCACTCVRVHGREGPPPMSRPENCRPCSSEERVTEASQASPGLGAQGALLPLSGAQKSGPCCLRSWGGGRDTGGPRGRDGVVGKGGPRVLCVSFCSAREWVSISAVSPGVRSHRESPSHGTTDPPALSSVCLPLMLPNARPVGTVTRTDGHSV